MFYWIAGSSEPSGLCCKLASQGASRSGSSSELMLNGAESQIATCMQNLQTQQETGSFQVLQASVSGSEFPAVSLLPYSVMFAEQK